MMTILIIKHTNTTYTAWMLAEGHPQCLVEQVEFDALRSALPDHNRRVLLWPGQLVTTTRVKLPKVSAAARLQAIPFALEEQLAGPVEQLFFAILAAEDDQGWTHVAVIDRQTFSTEIEQWQAADLPLDVVMPDFLALPLPEPSTWTLMLNESVARVRLSAYSGFTIEADQWVEWVQHYSQQAHRRPERIQCMVTSSTIDIPDLPNLAVKVDTKVESLGFAMDCLTAPPAANLLQGEFRAKHQISPLKRHWRRCGLSLAALIVIAVLGKVVNLIYLDHDIHRLKQVVRTQYLQIFPSATQVTAPRLRVAEQVAQLKKAQLGDPFIQHLSALANGMAASPGLRLDSLSYANNTLTIKVQARHTRQVQAFNQALLKQGLAVKQTQLLPGRQTVTAEFTLSEAR